MVVNIMLPRKLVYFIIIYYQIFLATASEVESDHWSLSDFIPKGYDRSHAPYPKNGKPVEVLITVNIDQLLSMNEADQSFMIDITYTQSWHDPRLHFPPTVGSRNETITPLSLTFLNKLWIPSVFLTNSLKPNLVQLTPRFLDIDTIGSVVVLTAKQVVKLKCIMNLFRFPMDSQICPIEFTLLITRKHRVALRLEDFSLGKT